ncbi:MAG: pyruvate dehydrogenase (acetyl-transferring) E1 component subunit alpha [Actinomycetota bacterium]|nr:pyruvate dehydrogenase (acetyl-transferring) E1 component subunit alpha [Actinomycetota bacterium]
MQDPFEDAVRILAPDGSADEQAAGALGLKDDDLRAMYRFIAVTRRVDVECTALQRQGELAVYPPLMGQEAAQIGSAYALGHDDFVFPSYREMGWAVVRGLDLVEYMHFHRGTRHGGIADPLGSRFGMISVPVGSQALHAVGWAMGAKLDGAAACAIVAFGDGATSQGDVSEAFNFAGVFRAPVIFFCQNNQWAISVPLARQTAAPIWTRAAGFGFPGVRVDGNDVLAVYGATRDAVRRAREGTPTLIEAVTYRIGPHSTADDATRYRLDEDVQRWRELDPLTRFRTYLDGRGLIDEELESTVEAEAARTAATVRAGIAGAPPRPIGEVFDWAYGELPPDLARQKQEAVALSEGHDG